MWEAIVENSQTVSGLSNALMVIIWLLYLQLFLVQFRRQKRPFLVIHHAHGLSPSADCLLINMSQETLHVQCVLARLQTNQGEQRVRQVADFPGQSADGPAGDEGGSGKDEPQQRLREGPLQPGGYLVLGTFQEIILGGGEELSGESSSGPWPADLSEVESLEISAAAVHGPTSHPVGARRWFTVESYQQRFLVRPQNIHTEQLTTFRKRRQVRRWVEQCLNPQQRGGWQTQQSDQSGD